LPLDPAVDDLKALPAEPGGLLQPAAGGQFAVGSDDAPPGEADTARQDIADRPRRSGVAGARGDLAVTGNLSPVDGADGAPNRFDEGNGRGFGYAPSPSEGASGG
jgi:hypothetical protein